MKRMLPLVVFLALALPAAQSHAQSEPGIVITMEGVTHELRDLNWTDSTITLEGDETFPIVGSVNVRFPSP